MTKQQQIDGLIAATREISLLRSRETLFTFPLADAKLIRICGYISKQIAVLEAEAWQEAGLLEPEVDWELLSTQAQGQI